MTTDAALLPGDERARETASAKGAVEARPTDPGRRGPGARGVLTA